MLRAGIDKAKLEVMELVDMLKSPAKYGKLGARLPKVPQLGLGPRPFTRITCVPLGASTAA